MKKNVLFLAIPLFLFLSILFIIRSAFTIDGTIHFALMDDAMISMRYAHNFADGLGLVWNAGEKIEGFTNLLWVLYMSIFHFLNIPLSITSLFIQISCVIFLTINLIYMKKLVDLIFNNAQTIAFISILLTVLYIPLLMWAVQGAEACILTMLTTVSVYYVCKSVKEKSNSILPFIFLGVGTLVRPDFTVIALPVVLYAMYKYKNKKGAIIGILTLGVFLVSQTLFRIIYFNDFVPNTYYLKMTGYPFLLRITAGLYVTMQFIVSMNWILFLVPFLTLLKKNSYTPLLFSIVFIQLAYNTYVGGDIGGNIFFSNRFVSIIMPLFFILFTSGIVTLYAILTSHIKIVSPKIRTGIIVVFLIGIVANFNVLHSYHVFQSFYAHKLLGYVGASKYNVEKALLVDSMTTQNAKVAVFWAGTTPYFSERYYIDLLGKNDKVIAHDDVNPAFIPKNYLKYIAFNPGHTKWDYQYSIATLLPDIIDPVSIDVNVNPSDRIAADVLNKKYIEVTYEDKRFYVLKESPHIEWSKINGFQKRPISIPL